MIKYGGKKMILTLKEVKEISLDEWRYFAEHPECERKSDLPDALWEKVVILRFHCPFCELFYKDSCAGCPLREAGERCDSDDHSPIIKPAYDRWNDTKFDDIGTRREAAKRIVEIISAWKPTGATE
jgi:hypothetical protein